MNNWSGVSRAGERDNAGRHCNFVRNVEEWEGMESRAGRSLIVKKDFGRM